MRMNAGHWDTDALCSALPLARLFKAEIALLLKGFFNTHIPIQIAVWFY